MLLGLLVGCARPIDPPNSAVAPADLALGVRALNGGQLSEAEAVAHRLVQVKPDEPSSFLLLGMSLYGQKNLPGAEEAYGKALALDPNHVEALVAMGNVKRDQQLWSEALTLYEQAYTIEPKYLVAYASSAYVYMMMDDQASVVRVLEKGVQAVPNAQMHGDLGQLYQSLGKADLAKRHFDQAKKLNASGN